MFQFKRFRICDELSGMKIGTDGVLIGAWAQCSRPERILDVGTGTGLIALMLAQRFPTAHITGIDIDPMAVEEAKRNIENSPWKNRIDIIETSLQSVKSDFFDMIVSNPPFFTPDKRHTSAEDAEMMQRRLARHTDSLPICDLIKHSARLLRDDAASTLSMILSPETAVETEKQAAIYGLFLRRKMNLLSKVSKPVKRVLLELGKTPANNIEVWTEAILDSEGKKSEWYCHLTRDFYLDACAD